MEGHGTAKTSTAEKPQGFPKDLAERFEDLGKNMFSTSLQITKRRILILNEKLKFTGTSSLPDCSFPKIISV